MPWSDCEKRLPEYCEALGLGFTGNDFVSTLKTQLTDLADSVDKQFPKNSEFSIDDDGTPHLKRYTANKTPKTVTAFKKEVAHRMPERHLLDILNHACQWSNYTRRFGPAEGSDPKLNHALSRYLYTVFGFGCKLGAGQTARHGPSIINGQTLRRINREHITSGKLDAALEDLKDEYKRLPLPKFWGDSKVAHRRWHSYSFTEKQSHWPATHPLR